MSFSEAWRALIGDGDAVWAFLSAAGIVLALTPLLVRIAPRMAVTAPAVYSVAPALVDDVMKRQRVQPYS